MNYLKPLSVVVVTAVGVGGAAWATPECKWPDCRHDLHVQEEAPRGGEQQPQVLRPIQPATTTSMTGTYRALDAFRYVTADLNLEK
jgi:hypothetical protein